MTLTAIESAVAAYTADLVATFGSVEAAGAGRRAHLTKLRMGYVPVTPVRRTPSNAEKLAAKLAGARFILLGCDDEQTVCDLCGKSDLKCTVVLQELDLDGNEVAIVRYGRDCGGRALRLSLSAARVEEMAREA